MYRGPAAVGCVGLAALTFYALKWDDAPDSPVSAPPPAVPATANLSGLPPPCRRRLQTFDTGRCTRRGDIGPTGEFQSCPTETEDVACVVLGRKPVALLHTMNSEVCVAVSSNALDSSVGPYAGGSGRSGPLPCRHPIQPPTPTPNEEQRFCGPTVAFRQSRTLSENFTLFGHGVPGRGGGGMASQGTGAHVFSLTSSKSDFPKQSFSILQNHNDPISRVKHVLDALCVCHGVPGVGVHPKGQPVAGSSKIEIFQADFCDILTTQDAQISHVKHGMAQYDLLRPLNCEPCNQTVCKCCATTSRDTAGTVIGLSSRCLAEGNRISTISNNSQKFTRTHLPSNCSHLNGDFKYA